MAKNFYFPMFWNAKIDTNCHTLSKIVKIFNIFNIFKMLVRSCSFITLSDQMSRRRSQVSSVALWMSSSKVLSQSVSEWQGHLLSCSGHFPWMVFCISITQYFFPSHCHLTHPGDTSILSSSSFSLSCFLLQKLKFPPNSWFKVQRR